MERLPGLRPAGARSEATTVGVRERDPAESERFDDHLARIDARERAPREPSAGSTRAEDGDGRRREAAAENQETKEPTSKPEQAAAEPQRQPPPTKDVSQPAKSNTSPRSASKPDASAAPAAETSVVVELQAVAHAASAPLEEELLPTAAPQTSAPAAPLAPQAQAASLVPMLEAALEPLLAGATKGSMISAAASAEEASAVDAIPPGNGPLGNGLSQPVQGSALQVALLQASSATEVPADFSAQLEKLAQTEATRAQTAAHGAQASETAAEILRQVRVGLSQDLREANIQLAPEHLGRVSIRLRVENGALSADVRAQTPEALAALERHAPELRAALAQHVGQGREVQFHFGFLHSNQGDAQGRQSGSDARSQFGRHEHSELAPAEVERALARRLTASGVDTYA